MEFTLNIYGYVAAQNRLNGTSQNIHENVALSENSLKIQAFKIPLIRRIHVEKPIKKASQYFRREVASEAWVLEILVFKSFK